MDDALATEFFLRSIILEMASKVVYVTNKWGRSTQISVANLVQQLDSHEDSSYHISPSNRLIIIHNRFDVSDLTNLQNWIKVVKNSYQLQRPPEGSEYNGIRSWFEENTVDKKYKYYTSYKTMHFFLLNNNLEENKLYNKSVIETIYNYLKTSSRKEFNFIDSICKIASKRLSQYIREWDSKTIMIEKILSESILRPVLIDTNNNDSLSSTITNFAQLQQIEITGYSTLQGQLWVDEEGKKMMVIVQVPGIAPGDISENTIIFIPNEDMRHFEVQVQLNKNDLPGQNLNLVSSTLKYGTGSFFAALPKPWSYVVDMEKIYTEKWIKVADGEIQISMPITNPVIKKYA